MGYTTNFEGSLIFDKQLTETQKEYINNFCSTRHYKRDTKKLMEKFKGQFGFPFENLEGKTAEDIYGIEGEYFVNGEQYGGGCDINTNECPGQISDKKMDYFKQHQLNSKLIDDIKCVPGLWCDWEVSKDGTELEWNGAEKFYYYIEWLKYLIDRFFNKWDVKLNGRIEWSGEETSDTGLIKVKDSVVTTVCWNDIKDSL